MEPLKRGRKGRGRKRGREGKKREGRCRRKKGKERGGEGKERRKGRGQRTSAVGNYSEVLC